MDTPILAGFVILIVLAATIVLLPASRKAKKTDEPDNKSEPPKPIPAEEPAPEETPAEESGVDYSQSYQAKYLLTKNEWHEYRKLKQYAQELGLQVCPKVRLLDIIEPRRGVQNYKSLFYKIQAKHVDFLLCDQNLYIKAIVELDDGSHDKSDRQERDRFVDQILTSVGYKVIRTRSITADTLKCLDIQAPQQK